ncbi:hypothetical protein KML24001_19410 [Alistipes onderdonkii subsp. vulgaris]
MRPPGGRAGKNGQGKRENERQSDRKGRPGKGKAATIRWRDGWRAATLSGSGSRAPGRDAAQRPHTQETDTQRRNKYFY